VDELVEPGPELELVVLLEPDSGMHWCTSQMVPGPHVPHTIVPPQPLGASPHA
jgi:hypothetical protein